MKTIEFEVERDTIELSYEEKILKLRHELHEQASTTADLEMQIKQSEIETHRICALIEELEHERNNELLKLEREYLATKVE